MSHYSPREAEEVMLTITKAIARADGHHDWDKLEPVYKSRYRRLADAAIASTPVLFVRPEAVVNVGLLPQERKVQIS